MMGELTPSQIEEVLTGEYIGRIGYNAQGRTYIVPSSYIYQGEAIYAHSLTGMKVEMTGSNPEVCFEVEQISTLHDWRNVIAWGRFEELSGDDALKAMRLFNRRLGFIMPVSGSAELHLGSPAEPRRMPVLYRIRLREKTGRYEPCPG